MMDGNMNDMIEPGDIYELDELLGAYALDAVSPDEASRTLRWC